MLTNEIVSGTTHYTSMRNVKNPAFQHVCIPPTILMHLPGVKRKYFERGTT